MIVRTTRARWRRLRDVVECADNEALYKELGYVWGGESDRSRVRVEMCVAAAVQVRELMIRRCYTDRETMRRGLSSSEHGALRDLVTSINVEQRHPALRGVGMVGHVAQFFPVWPRQVGDVPWSLLPYEGAAMQILRPVWHCDENHGSVKVTLWSTEGGYAPSESRLFDPALHWRFV